MQHVRGGHPHVGVAVGVAGRQVDDPHSCPFRWKVSESAKVRTGSAAAGAAPWCPEGRVVRGPPSSAPHVLVRHDRRTGGGHGGVPADVVAVVVRVDDEAQRPAAGERIHRGADLPASGPYWASTSSAPSGPRRASRLPPPR